MEKGYDTLHDHAAVLRALERASPVFLNARCSCLLKMTPLTSHD